MAILQGVVQYTGKLGQTVGQRSATGKHAVRVYRDTIKNPRTNGQSVQRMILATVGVAISYLTEILNNAFEGVQNGAASLNYARRLWLNMLRNLTASQNPSVYNYLPKGQKLFIPNPYQISSGRLAAPNIYFTTGGQIISGLNVGLTQTASQAFPMVAVGDQITLIGVGMIYSEIVQTEVGYCRFAFKDDTTPVFIQNTDGDTVLNPAAIDLSKAQGNWQGLLWDAQENTGGTVSIGAMLSDNVEDVGAVGIVISNIENKRRSTSYLVLNPAMNLSEYAGGLVYPTYGNNGVEMDFPNDWYLNNSARRIAASEGGQEIALSSNLPLETTSDPSISIGGVPSNEASDLRDFTLNIDGVNYNFGNYNALVVPAALQGRLRVDYSTVSNNSISLGFQLLGSPVTSISISSGSFVYDGTTYVF